MKRNTTTAQSNSTRVKTSVRSTKSSSQTSNALQFSRSRPLSSLSSVSTSMEVLPVLVDRSTSVNAFTQRSFGRGTQPRTTRPAFPAGSHSSLFSSYSLPTTGLRRGAGLNRSIPTQQSISLFNRGIGSISGGLGLLTPLRRAFSQTTQDHITVATTSATSATPGESFSAEQRRKIVYADDSIPEKDTTQSPASNDSVDTRLTGDQEDITPLQTSSDHGDDDSDPSLPRQRGTMFRRATDEYKHLTEEQRHEMRQRFLLENANRMHSALTKLRSTTGTIAYGVVAPIDGPDGALPQRNGSYSKGATDIVQRAYEYKRRQEERKKQQQKQEEVKKQTAEQLRIHNEFYGDTNTPDDTKPFVREFSPEELENQRAEQLMGKNWLSRWF